MFERKMHRIQLGHGNQLIEVYVTVHYGLKKGWCLLTVCDPAVDNRQVICANIEIVCDDPTHSHCSLLHVWQGVWNCWHQRQFSTYRMTGKEFLQVSQEDFDTFFHATVVSNRVELPEVEAGD